MLQRELRSNAYIPSMTKTWYFRLCSDDFLHDLVAQLVPRLFAPSESLDIPNTMYINVDGIAAKLGRPMSKGAVWGVDFLLDHSMLFEVACATALT